MALWPRPADETAPPDLDEISRDVHAFGRGRLPDWEAGYLEYHRRRYQDTLRLLPPGEGRRLLDVGSFPGHLSALARARGWDVVGLNNAIEGGGRLDRVPRALRRPGITIRDCEVEQAPFPLPTASVDAVLFCELFEHLHLNPFHTLKEIFRVLRPGGPPRAHHAQSPARRDPLAPLARLGDAAAGEPRVPRALPVPPLSPPQPRVHGGRARVLPRAPGQGSLRLPPRPRLLLGRARRAARDPRRPRASGRAGGSCGSPDGCGGCSRSSAASSWCARGGPRRPSSSGARSARSRGSGRSRRTRGRVRASRDA